MGFIKNIIAGIFSFIAGLLPGKKKGSGYYLELKEPESATVSTPAAKVSQPVAVASVPAKTKPAKAEKSNNGKVITPEPVAVVKTSNPSDVAFASKYLSPSIVISNGRRRPGANMNAFLDLASQVKVAN